jgi:aspartate/methionine/tyrosine aminotransferase
LDAVKASPYPLIREENWAIDFDTLARASTPRTRAVVVVHPHNPTGRYLRAPEAGRLAAFCAERKLALISDEVFYDYAFAPDLRRAPPLVSYAGTLVFSLGGLSKFAGLPQMKLGWIAAGAPATEMAEMLDRLEWIADSYLPVSAPIQFAAASWLAALAPARRAAILGRTKASLTYLESNLPPEIRLLRPEGGWSAILEVPRLRSEDDWVLSLLERQGVLVQPGYFYDLDREGFLVISLLSEPAALKAAVEGLRTLL